MIKDLLQNAGFEEQHRWILPKATLDELKYLRLLEDAVLLILHKLNLPFIGIIVQM